MNGRLEIHDRIQLAQVEVSESAIKELLDICQALNERIDALEARLNQQSELRDEHFFSA